MTTTSITNLHAFALQVQQRYVERVQAEYQDTGIQFLRGSKRNDCDTGIHLFTPETWDIEAAVQQAQHEGFDTIILYGNQRSNTP